MSAAAHLASADPGMAALIARIGPCGLTSVAREPYEALVRAVSHQQLHARAAEAILGRFVALHGQAGFPAPGAVLAMDEAAMRGCGLSGAKAAAIRDIAARALDGTIPGFEEACGLSDTALVDRLIPIRGVGRWTVEMMLIFTLGRPDVLPVDDWAVREGWRLVQRLPQQPKPRALSAIGSAWAPYRSTAAWYLWRAADEAKTDTARRGKRPATLPGPA